MARKKKSVRKKKKITAAEFKINLILVVAVLGISILLLLVRHYPSQKSIPLPERTFSKDVSHPPVVDPSPIVSPSVELTPAQKPVKKPVEHPPVVRPEKPVTPYVPVVPPLAPPPKKTVPPKKKGTLLFVFDDAGYNLVQLERFLQLPFPCTIAVLPGLQYSAEAAKRIRNAGKELILHQPMQALNLNMDPGPGAIKQGMTPEQIRSIMKRNLDEVWPVVGFNNHEGSLITADRNSMQVVLEIARERDIYFLDSRTNAETVAPALAREMNMTIWERSVFLDNSQDRLEIIESVRNGVHIAEKKGMAIMIGHIWSNDLADILVEMYPDLAAQGYSLSTIAKIAIEGDVEE